jgi:pimeloyl-ACP methyl ester carboxylesterase
MARNTSFLSLPQCGHLPHEEKPQEVNATLIDFLESDLDVIMSCEPVIA